MVISRSSYEVDALQGKINFGDDTLQFEDDINILGVDFDNKLNFQKYIKETARKTSLKINILRRMKHLLDSKGLLTLYKAQVRSQLEYASLVWISSARSHLHLFYKVQRRAERLISSTGQQEATRNLDTLEHRRRVAAITVLHKAQIQHVPHLEGLRMPWRQSQRSTRSVLASDCQVEVPRSRTSLHQRTFAASTSRLWNDITTQIEVWGLTTQQVKLAAHSWCLLHPPD